MRIPLSQEELEENARGIAREVAEIRSADEALALILEIGTECFALPPNHVSEIVPMPRVQPLPHNRRSALLGIANVRGILRPVVDLGVVILGTPIRTGEEHYGAVLEFGEMIVLCPLMTSPRLLALSRRGSPIPPTLLGAALVQDIVDFQGESVGRLDVARFAAAIREELA